MIKQPVAFVATVALSFAVATSAPAQETDFLAYGVQFEELEFRYGDENEKGAAWDGDAFVGTDEIKLRWLGKGEYDIRDQSFERLENRLVVQTPITTFFDVKAGVRLDTPSGPDRWYGVVGLAGLAKQWFEIDVDLFVSETGDASARLDVEYQILLTNRLILIPSAELDVAFSDDREIGVGPGISFLELGLRLSYDVIDRALSPYVGVVYEQKLGQTANFAEQDGEDTGGWFVTVGFRLLI